MIYLFKKESLVSELETAMSLFAFDSSTLEDSPLAELMDNSQRQNTASQVNAAILKSIHQEQGEIFKDIFKQKN